MEVQSKGSVLLVEDHQDIAELVYDYMEGEGYELDYAPDGEVLVAAHQAEGVTFATLEPSVLTSLRQAFPVGLDADRFALEQR